MSSLTVGTRGSPLALWQAGRVAQALRTAHPGLDVQVEIVRTAGDSEPHAPIAALGSGVFVRALERALLSGEIDLAVHSLKDLPTELPKGLMLGAILERHDPRDALLSPGGHGLDTLPAGTVVGTGSPRRRSQILHRRPDLQVVPVRGNVGTRVDKLTSGDVGALVLAVAGIERLGLLHVPRVPLDPAVCLPAAGQGAIALEVRSADVETRRWVAVTNDPDSETCSIAERAFLDALGGGCLAPATAFAEIDSGTIRVEGRVGTSDGRALLAERESGPAERAQAIGVRLAKRLLAAGGAAILARERQDRRG